MNTHKAAARRLTEEEILIRRKEEEDKLVEHFGKKIHEIDLEIYNKILREIDIPD